MRVHELIRLLQSCNPKAEVVIAKENWVEEYQYPDDLEDVVGIRAWNEPKETAEKIEVYV